MGVCHPNDGCFPFHAHSIPKEQGFSAAAGTGFMDSFPLDLPFQTQPFSLPSRSVSALHCTRVFLGLCQIYPHF